MYRANVVHRGNPQPGEPIGHKHEAIIVAEDEVAQDSKKDGPPTGTPTESQLFSAEPSGLLWQRVGSLPRHEMITVSLLFLVCASFVLNQCGVARADVEHHQYVAGAFSLPTVTFLTWSLTIILAYATHMLVAPLSLTSIGEKQLRCAAEFSAYMVCVFVCQSTMLLPRHNKAYNRDLFGALMLLLVVASALTLSRIPQPVARTKPAPVERARATDELHEKESLLTSEVGGNPALGTLPVEELKTVPHGQVEPAVEKPKAPPGDVYHIAPLCRQQTTEWRGWMQVLFLYYHYFHATEVYNAARLCVSAYVWMTGYGNFFFYTRQKDFGMVRFSHTMWRLNFFAFCLCCVLGNQYMLYYICPMHTLFTLFLYGALYFRQDMNTSAKGVVTKLAVLTAIAVVVWDLGALSTHIFRTFSWPLTWLLRYDSPVKTPLHPLDEWQYRTGLDHLVWIAGMAVAQFQPTFDTWLKHLDAMPAVRGAVFKAVIGLATIGATVVYVKAIYLQDRKTYNKWHPYTSFIPLTLYVVLRNLIQRSRMYYSRLLYYLGNVTLETYLLQFHVWMSMVTVNGPPWKVLGLISGGPLCNFVLFSCFLVAMSERIFKIVQIIESIVLPDKVPNGIILRNILFTFAVVLSTTALLCPLTNYFVKLPYDM